MGKSTKPSVADQVSDYLKGLQHPMKPVLESLRRIIPAVSPLIAEQIKWNSLSFHYTGDIPNYDPKTYQRDLIVCNLHKQDHVLLVFPTGATISDPTALLEGKFPDTRKVLKLHSVAEAESKAPALQLITKALLEKFPS